MQGVVLAWALAASVTLAPPTDEQAPSPVPGAIGSTDAEQETFLKEAKIVRTRGAGGGGITGARRATLRQGELQHDALSRRSTRKGLSSTSPAAGSWNSATATRTTSPRIAWIACSGLGMVPVTVVRLHEGQRASFTWWVEDVLMVGEDAVLYELPRRVPEVPPSGND